MATCDGNQASPLEVIKDIKMRAIDAIGSIKDPDHTESLRELGVVSEEEIQVEEISGGYSALIRWKPNCYTCPHASNMALCMRYKLQEAFNNNENIKIDILLKDDGHSTKYDIDKQVNDKERVAAALEKKEVVDMIKEST
ncbi:unnamed protein product [Blepharisma stoltei]|uniref:MIP18 family-like domain-containing protein n=1 Tax=Blepharisma stoltei TaxID=1481888 RepID=A0AAU9JBZ9_9CILI|nr:unnamed protein product [Blepharisma stoltei]